MKRSRKIQLAAMGVAGATVLSGCGGGTRAPDTPVFTTVQDCATSGDYTQAECQAALQYALSQQANSDAPRYVQRNQCEQIYGNSQCYSYNNHGQSVWMPLLGGFLLGQLWDNGRRDYHYYNYGGHWSTYDSRLGRTDRSYRTPANVPRPAKAVIPKPSRQHTAAITRGGFGSSSSSSWGG